MNSTPAEQIVFRARDLIFHNRELSLPAAIRAVIQSNPDLARKANLTIERATAFANSLSAQPAQASGKKANKFEIAEAIRKAGVENPNLSYGELWDRVRRSGPAFANAMSNPAFGTTPMPNALEGRTTASASATAAAEANEHGVPHAEITRLCLPFDCADDEYQVAKSGSSSPQAVFDRLVKWIMGKNGMTQDSANAYAAGRFQKLARLVQVPGIKINTSQGHSYDPSQSGN